MYYIKYMIFCLENKSGGHQASMTVSLDLRSKETALRGAGADIVDLQTKWGKWALSNAQGPRRTPSALGRVLLTRSSTYDNLNLNTATAAWKWKKHILKQMALIN